MKAIIYTSVGASDVLELAERPTPSPGPGEVRVRVRVSGVNATDWKCRQFGHVQGKLLYPEVIPHHDGSGVIDAVGEGVDRARTGQRVWLWDAAWRRPAGTAAEYVVVPQHQAVALPPEVSDETGAGIGLPAVAAHACLLAMAGAPAHLGPGTLTGRRVLVVGGTGTVGHAAIQLAVWSGAEVVATASRPEQEKRVRAAGAQHAVDYRAGTAVTDVRAAVPDGVDLIVQVAPSAYADVDQQVLAPAGTVAVYATEGRGQVTLPTAVLMGRNTRYQFVLGTTLPAAAKEIAVSDVATAVAAGALTVGADSGLPVLRFPLERTAEAHDAVKAGSVGKVLVDVAMF
ncbi:NADPH:quinone reductase [Actinoplanes sp. N902-109]|uniref:NADPH:quinone reductase n=1 Tax=Actinoplanes sp. (strain N902-109) TaxID=649831 RepID=UPI0003293642|nr:NADPH:quinone reductase [Actinoplanes sp. N902-109]AGL19224.1 Alcohol dehydrogenase zinc-binding domain protein [Actinoplanes sp. N902-109]